MTFKELATKRFSVRKYTDEPVSKEDIEYIMDCVRLAPSACNRQPWKFLLLTSDDAKEKIRQCYNRDWFKSAPVYVLCYKDFCFLLILSVSQSHLLRRQSHHQLEGPVEVGW